MNVAFNFSGLLPVIPLGAGLEIPTYFLIVSLAFCACLLWLVRRSEARGLSRNSALDLSLVVMIAGFLGARLLHIFFEEPAYYREAPARALEVWRGGFVWYGGALLGCGAGVLFARRRKMDVALWLDVFAPVLALGYALGRFACFLAGCCYGDICRLSSVSFRYPTQVFAILWELGALALIVRAEKNRRAGRGSYLLRPSGRLFALWVFLHALGRVIMEAFRGDPRGPEIAGLSLATWISFLLLGAVAAFFLKRHPSR